MTAQTPTEEKVSPPKAQETTRLLLALWELGVHTKALKKGKRGEKGELPDRAKRPAKVFNQLVEDGAIKVKEQMVSLETKGVERLAEELKTVDFAINGATTGAWIARGLLKWLQQMETVTAIASTNGKAKTDAIASYEAFKSVALEVYDRLNRDYNLDDLVPIYRIRQELSDQATRSQFDGWLLEMQANDLVQLMGGEMPDITPDRRENSITIPGGGFRYYAKRLTA